MANDVARLESIAQQLAGRVHTDDPEANLRWLRAQLGTDPQAPVTDQERLLFVLAAAVPDTRRWRDLTAWCSGVQPGRPPRWTKAEQELHRRALEQAMTPPRRREGHGRAEAA